jgi:hypothetical protein
MNESGTKCRGWWEQLRRRPEAPSSAPAADPAWMTGVTPEAAALAAEGRDEGWLVSSWELRRGLSVREGVSQETLWRLWTAAQAVGCDLDPPPPDPQAERSTSRRTAAPSSITASA